MNSRKYQLIQEILSHLTEYDNPVRAFRVWKQYESDFKNDISGLQLALRTISETRTCEELDIRLDKIRGSDNPNPHSSFKLEKDISLDEL